MSETMSANTTRLRDEAERQRRRRRRDLIQHVTHELFAKLLTLLRCPAPSAEVEAQAMHVLEQGLTELGNEILDGERGADHDD